MATSVPGFPTKRSSEANFYNLPPQRGRIKREIVSGLAKSIASAAAKAGGAFARNFGDGGSSASAATTPPTSGYASDLNGKTS